MFVLRVHFSKFVEMNTFWNWVWKHLLPCNTKVWVKKKQDTFRNWSLVKNLQFLSNPHETWLKWLPHELILFTKFHEDWTKIVEFLLMANLWTWSLFYVPDHSPNWFKLVQIHSRILLDAYDGGDTVMMIAMCCVQCWYHFSLHS